MAQRAEGKTVADYREGQSDPGAVRTGLSIFHHELVGGRTMGGKIPGTAIERVMRALAEGTCTASEIKERMSINRDRVQYAIDELVRRGEVRAVGRIPRAHGGTPVPVYGLSASNDGRLLQECWPMPRP